MSCAAARAAHEGLQGFSERSFNMRKNILRGAGLLLVLGSLLGFTPTPTAAQQAQTCACNVLCIQGDHCCTDVVNGQCQVSCVPNNVRCPK